jgi:hypothetical protein
MISDLKEDSNEQINEVRKSIQGPTQEVQHYGRIIQQGNRNYRKN